LALVLSAIPLLLRERAELRAELTALEAIAEERRERAKRAELELAELRQHASEKP
jgi:predicted nuclease with TOPRIM domain